MERRGHEKKRHARSSDVTTPPPPAAAGTLLTSLDGEWNLKLRVVSRKIGRIEFEHLVEVVIVCVGC